MIETTSLMDCSTCRSYPCKITIESGEKIIKGKCKMYHCNVDLIVQELMDYANEILQLNK